VKYELTGGFIKNAVLSALLRAIARNAEYPVVSHEDLIEGCKLQMRGSLRLRSVGVTEGIPDRGLDDLIVSRDHRKVLDKLIRFEKARSTVYGTWRGDAHVELDPLASIMLFVGPSGSGKRTIARALGYDVGRPVRLIHIAHVIGSSLGETMRGLDALVSDARLVDGLVVLDGFENVLEEASATSDSWKLHLVLSRLIDKLESFPGAVVLLCHVDNPTNVTLQRELASKLFGILRFTTPPHEVRARLWKCLLPAKAPLAKDVDFDSLGRKFELQPSAIASACVRAAAEAAMKTQPAADDGHKPRVPKRSRDEDVDEKKYCETRDTWRSVSQTDLMQAGEAEVKKQKGCYEELLEGLFI
jgi:SpoVK/Ycf46/Vps4 family AAA+-type ATPase